MDAEVIRRRLRKLHMGGMNFGLRPGGTAVEV